MHSKPSGHRNPGSPAQRHPQEPDMPGPLRGIARTAAVAGTASAVGGRVRHRQDQKWARQDAQSAAPAPAYAAPAPAYAAPAPAYAEPAQSSAPPAKDKLQQLKELGDLKAQ